MSMATGEAAPRTDTDFDLSELLPEEEWNRHKPVIELAMERGVPFALGGGLAFSTYSRRWRNTKDLDLFIRPADQKAMVDIVTQAAFADYYPWKPYDRSWIYRGVQENIILDLIWSMPNHRMVVDDAWLTTGQEVVVHGARMRLLPPEELLWSKLYVMQRDRCDWPDLLNLLFGIGAELNWEHLLDRVGEDAPVLASLVGLYGWLCPVSSARLPEWLWKRVGLRQPDEGPDCASDSARTHVLDTRDWFGPTRPDKPATDAE